MLGLLKGGRSKKERSLPGELRADTLYSSRVTVTQAKPGGIFYAWALSDSGWLLSKTGEDQTGPYRDVGHRELIARHVRLSFQNLVEVLNAVDGFLTVHLAPYDPVSPFVTFVRFQLRTKAVGGVVKIDTDGINKLVVGEMAVHSDR
ncbi:hypothetical protein ACYZT4_09420 [Pseudomonas sp. GB2N2]